MSTFYVIVNDPGCAPVLYLHSYRPGAWRKWTPVLEEAIHHADIVSAKRVLDKACCAPWAVVRVDHSETVLTYEETLRGARSALEPEYVGKHRVIDPRDKDCRYTWVDGGGYTCRCIEPAGSDGFCDRHHKGCCSSCDGTGVANDPSTNGKCWDCRGTGHVHL